MPSRACEEAYQSFCLQKHLASPFGRAHEGEGEESLVCTTTYFIKVCFSL